MKLEPCPGSSIGAFVSGVALDGDLPESSVAAIEDALFRFQVLVFRGQSLTAGAQIGFARRLGVVSPPEPSAGLTTHEAEHPEVQWLGHGGGATDARPSQADTWHTDYSYLPHPPELACLSGVEIPPDGPDTFYVDMAAAYDALPDDRKALVDGLRAVHTQRGGLDPSVYRLPPYVTEGVVPDEALSAERTATHPVVRTHPVTGRRSFYLSECYVVGFEGVPEEEGRRLLATLYRDAAAPERTFRHVWREGDCVVSDNTTSNHRRSAPLSSPRVLRRVMVGRTR